MESDKLNLEFVKGVIFTLLNDEYIIKSNGHVLGEECFKGNFKTILRCSKMH